LSVPRLLTRRIVLWPLGQGQTRKAAMIAGLPVLLLVILLVLLCSSAALGQGRLDDIRYDVRGLPVPSSSPPSPGQPSEPAPDSRQRRSRDYDYYDENSGMYDDFMLGTVMLGLFAATSPVTLPYGAIDDGLQYEYFFPRFPYDHTSGYMMGEQAHEILDPLQGGGYTTVAYPTAPRRWSARVRAEYANNFDGIERIGGHLLLSTTSRWGLDTQIDYLSEDFCDARHDNLWLGDANVVFRFAQSENMQWRIGLGMNWLDDPVDTEVGFNFTYGMDYFLGQPWVISSTLDWGTLGHAELFRGRATIGVIIHGVEAYTGFEYLDIDRTQLGSLVSGIRIWF
jgi:hypothetical protein